MDELAVAMKAREFIGKCGPLALPVSVDAYAGSGRRGGRAGGPSRARRRLVISYADWQVPHLRQLHP